MPLSSTERRYRAGDLIRRRGVEMEHPCEPCQRRGRQCFANSSTGICSENSSTGICSECYTFHRKCNLVVSRSTWKRLESEQERLKRDLERVEREKQRLQKRLQRVQNDERRLLSQELQSIEEMEGLEAAEADRLVETGPAVASGVEGSSSTTAARDPVRPNDQHEDEPGVQDAGQPGLDQVEFDQLDFDQMDSGDVDWSELMDLVDWGFDDETLRLA